MTAENYQPPEIQEQLTHEYEIHGQDFVIPTESRLPTNEYVNKVLAATGIKCEAVAYLKMGEQQLAVVDMSESLKSGSYRPYTTENYRDETSPPIIHTADEKPFMVAYFNQQGTVTVRPLETGRSVAVGRNTGMEGLATIDMPKEDRTVSREHARFYRDVDGTLHVVDSSRNGTYVKFGAESGTEQSQEVEMPSFTTSEDIGELAVKSAIPAGEDFKNPEIIADSRIARIFAPVIIEKPKEVATDYSHLFDPNYEPPVKQPTFGVEKSIKGREVTEYTQAVAVQQLERTLKDDKEIASILALHVNADGIDKQNPNAIVDYIRENLGVRVALGELFLGRLDKLAKEGVLGDRLAANKQKTSNIPGYSNGMTSREYAALLAMAKLDGTWDYERQTESIDMDKDGIAIRGQHRDAALRLV
jgi:hypothetical protein